MLTASTDFPVAVPGREHTHPTNRNRIGHVRTFPRASVSRIRRLDSSTSASRNHRAPEFLLRAIIIFCTLTGTRAPDSFSTAKVPPRPPITAIGGQQNCVQSSMASGVSSFANYRYVSPPPCAPNHCFAAARRHRTPTKLTACKAAPCFIPFSANPSRRGLWR